MPFSTARLSPIDEHLFARCEPGTFAPYWGVKFGFPSLAPDFSDAKQLCQQGASLAV